MIVTVKPDGGVVIDTDDPAAAVAFVNALRNNTPKKRRRKKTIPVPPGASVSQDDFSDKLSPQLAEVHTLLFNADSDYTPAMVADELGIERATASWRLARLLERGLVTKTGRGTYRAVP